jgi:hypothetical protein
MHMMLGSLFMLVSKRREMRKNYSRGIIVHEKGSLRRRYMVLVMNLGKKEATETDGNQMWLSSTYFVKLDSGKKYQISSMVEEHSHGFVSPDKRHLLRSNRKVNERAKSTLFNCHKASIGTSQAYRLPHVSEGGFENVGCTRGICKIIIVTSEPKSRMQMHKCLRHNLSKRRK